MDEKPPPFYPTLVPTFVAYSLLEKAALGRLIFPQLLCYLSIDAYREYHLTDAYLGYDLLTDAYREYDLLTDA